MKTKAGKYMLKELTKKMNDLNQDARKLANRLSNLDPNTPERHYYTDILDIVDDYNDNRDMHRTHQQVINSLKELEDIFLEDKK